MKDYKLQATTHTRQSSPILDNHQHTSAFRALHPHITKERLQATTPSSGSKQQPRLRLRNKLINQPLLQPANQAPLRSSRSRRSSPPRRSSGCAPLTRATGTSKASCRPNSPPPNRSSIAPAMSSVASDSSWAAKKAPKRLGGMAEALSIASDLGFSVPPVSDDLANPAAGDKSDELIRVLRELSSVQRSIANLQVELQGRKDDKNVAHLTHVSEMEKKCESLARITAILKDVIQNKDRIIARLQQPYSLDCIPVEAEYQKQFSELLLKAASDYGALTASIADFQWSQNFRESPSIWGEMLRPIPAALASCTRFFEAMSAMRESFTTLQQLRTGHSSTPMTPIDSSSEGNSKFLTPPQWNGGTTSSNGSVVGSWRLPEEENQWAEAVDDTGDGIDHRRLSWPPSLKNGP